jgi:ABC-type sugar transport system ATPase subunit
MKQNISKEDKVLELKKITKSFSGVKALSNVDFELKRGEVHALVGANGAGKSTLIKVLTGYYEQYDGQIFLNGNLVNLQSPKDALLSGICAIYQDVFLVPSLSITENIYLGMLKEKDEKLVNFANLNKKAWAILKRLDLDVDPERLVSSLSMAQCKIIEIAKVIVKNVQVLVLDEPTAALPKKEKEVLFSLIEKLKKEGMSIIYISHFLDEIFSISDRVTILRNGKKVGLDEANPENRNSIIRSMVGRKLENFHPRSEKQGGGKLLSIKSLTRKGKYKNISMDLNKGEILGVFGLLGSGHQNIIRGIAGAEEIDEGNIYKREEVVTIKTVKDAKDNSIILLPGDRKQEALLLNQSLINNVSLGNYKIVAKKGVLKLKFEESKVRKYIRDLKIKTFIGPKQLVGTLSGGNQQKIVLSRLLESKSDVLILENPTAGVDIGAKADIYKIMNDCCSTGKGIIILSEDIMEVLSMSDRIVVIKNGQVAGILQSKDTSKEDILNLAL